MQPLADKLRPQTIDTFVGQKQLFGENGILTRIFNKKIPLPSMIFWGPAGTGKTTIAKMLLQREDYFSETISATNTGVAELKQIFQLAENRYKDFNKSTILFIDEIHCFKKNQQDVLLPYVESGVIILIGATTENPSFELNTALLSRCRILIFKTLDFEDLELVVDRVEKECGKLPLTKEARKMLVNLSNGDCRYLLNMCEELLNIDTSKKLNIEELLKIVNKRKASYDKKDDNHYNLISAFHKSLRGSDVQAALYWMARMLDGGERHHYIFRRLINFATEDIGMADPQAIIHVMACLQAFDMMGEPDGTLCLSNAVVYCANAPKSNAVYMAQDAVFKDVKTNNYQNPPKHILNAPTKLMKNIGYSEGYIYDHDTPNCFSGQNYFPEGMERREYYRPNERGFERELKKRLEYWGNLRKVLKNKVVY